MITGFGFDQNHGDDEILEVMTEIILTVPGGKQGYNARSKKRQITQPQISDADILSDDSTGALNR